MTRIQTDTKGLRKTTLLQFGARFLFGGAATVLASLVSRKWGPVVGGLFLAFPGIFPPGASLVEQHAIERKQQAGMHGEERGRKEASLEAAGASCGALGLLAFAAVLHGTVDHTRLPVALLLAMLAWALVSAAAWMIRERM